MRLGLYRESAGDYMRRHEYRGLLHRVVELLYSEAAGVVVGKDLTDAPELPANKRKPPIRPASLKDVLTLVDLDTADELDPEELWQRRLRTRIANDFGVDNCFVADADDGTPAFMQYLFTSTDNDRLQAEFPGLFPTMTEADSVVEFLYVAPHVRNPGIAVNGLTQVADEARRRGATSVISFIYPDNKGALFVNHLAGYQAQGIRRSKRRFGRLSYTFEPWPEGASRSLADVAGGKVEIS